jgi:N-glycosylase/DNA lyase
VFLFSPNLIEETIKVFKEENGVVFSVEQANYALNNMAGLFLAFVDTDIESDTKGVSDQPQTRRAEAPFVAPEPVSVDLIIP